MRKRLSMNPSRWLAVAVLLAIAHAAPAQEPRVAFATSVTGDVVLGSWPDADDANGVAAADNICQNRATAGGLANPENFVAWISDSSDDAYCRLHGLAGKKADNCGQPSLPAAAGPWVRTDGYPFAPDIEQLLVPNNVVYAPPRFDEFGAITTIRLMTATGHDGTLAGTACDDWTDNSISGLQLGNSFSTSGGWTNGTGAHCSYSPAALLCLESGAGPALPPFAESGHMAFVTSAFGNGNLGGWPEADAGTSGIAAGDSICRNLAHHAGRPHAARFRAWLSDDTTDAISRIAIDGPWVRVDGVPIATDKAELTGQDLFTAISQTELGDYPVSSTTVTNVWTGTQADGSSSTNHCQSWSDDTDTHSGTRGLSHYVVPVWTAFTSIGCHHVARLYCLSDPSPVVFHDRFETP